MLENRYLLHHHFYNIGNHEISAIFRANMYVAKRPSILCLSLSTKRIQNKDTCSCFIQIEFWGYMYVIGFRSSQSALSKHFARYLQTRYRNVDVYFCLRFHIHLSNIGEKIHIILLSMLMIFTSYTEIDKYFFSELKKNSHHKDHFFSERYGIHLRGLIGFFEMIF